MWEKWPAMGEQEKLSGKNKCTNLAGLKNEVLEEPAARSHQKEKRGVRASESRRPTTKSKSRQTWNNCNDSPDFSRHPDTLWPVNVSSRPPS